MSMIRVNDTYYMSCTTMHMSPGVPILKSKDLSNWEMVSYCYDTLGDKDELNLLNGKSNYGKGTWASCFRYHNNRFYVSTFSQTTNQTYIFSTDDPESGKWKKRSFTPSCHDHSIFFDDDGHTYIIWGAGKLFIAELEEDLSGIKEGSRRVLIENASQPSGTVGLQAEGSQLFKVNGTYYLFNISWPRNGMRTVLIHRAPSLNGPWEGKVALQDRGIAQGGLIDTPDGKWFAYIFRDYGSVGRIPYLAPVHWEDGWPVLGVDGKVPDQLDLPAQQSIIGKIVACDEFKRKKNDIDLPLAWQWNHQPDNSLWSVRERKGFMRLRTGRIDNGFTSARNTLTQRTFGPVSSATVALDFSHLKEGDFAGLGLLQQRYGQVGVTIDNGEKYIVMIMAEKDEPKTIERIPIRQKKVFLKASCDFTDLKDTAEFYYSLDNKNWIRIGSTLKMAYTIPQFMGYRFALFNYATKIVGGYADFDFFHISDKK